MVQRALYLPLFAKAQLVVGPLAMIAVLILYPQRKKEAEAYSRSPICTGRAIDLTACRRLTLAELVRINCPSEYKGLESCELELRVDGRKAFIGLLRGSAERLTPGSQIRVEMMGNIATMAEVEGKLVRDYGSPDGAMAKMRLMAATDTILTAAAAAYLWWRRRQAATSGAVD